MSKLKDKIRNVGSRLLDETVSERYGMEKHHPPEDIPAWFIIEVNQLIREQVDEYLKEEYERFGSEI